MYNRLIVRVSEFNNKGNDWLKNGHCPGQVTETFGYGAYITAFQVTESYELVWNCWIVGLKQKSSFIALNFIMLCR
jgi:hypothetical protein